MQIRCHSKDSLKLWCAKIIPWRDARNVRLLENFSPHSYFVLCFLYLPLEVFLQNYFKTNREEVPKIIAFKYHFCRCLANLGTASSIIDLYYRVSLCFITASSWQRNQNERNTEDFRHENICLWPLLFSNLSYLLIDHICTHYFYFCDPGFILLDRSWWLNYILPGYHNLRSKI